MIEQPVQVDESRSRGSRVVVGVDGSAGARAALRFAVEDAVRRDVPVEAVTSHRPPEVWMDFDAIGGSRYHEAEAAAVERAEAFVAEVLREVPEPHPVVHVTAVLGSAADALVRESDGADLLVVGSRGRGGFSTMLLGSTSMQCVLHASCPVTVVHSPESHRERLHLRRRDSGERPRSHRRRFRGTAADPTVR
ncbi:Nucleotide-binding universal stress protein, UspA family [Geodermatophilus amargosae]|jgi:nucleotide-binding universal stress UspA family protein|uniref:Nucleotide-binding universal stress protein, UspA family n=1 Tax=Geodermatophilus amargosae TaxID=1296565 RepID=A0A1I6X4J0_9ACTN|nr:universal stress protein [Geodermatophilus amargosae]SFT33160.1 Nucleotide-binding universal stress protein, UspA family [Geodermatophilus amargosae]